MRPVPGRTDKFQHPEGKKSNKEQEETDPRKREFVMTKAEFLRYFCSENIVGTIHMFMKKLLDGATQVPVDFNYMPMDLLYPLVDKAHKESDKSENEQFAFGSAAKAAAKDVFKSTFKEAFKKRVRDYQEQNFLGMTIGYKLEPTKDDKNKEEMILEAPIERERNFVIMNSLQLQRDRTLTFIRKIMEIQNGKKLRNLLYQKYLVRRIHEDQSIKPQFVPIGNEVLAGKRARIVDYLDEEELEADEAKRLDVLLKQSEQYQNAEAEGRID